MVLFDIDQSLNTNAIKINNFYIGLAPHPLVDACFLIMLMLLLNKHISVYIIIHRRAINRNAFENSKQQKIDGRTEREREIIVEEFMIQAMCVIEWKKKTNVALPFPPCWLHRKMHSTYYTFVILRFDGCSLYCAKWIKFGRAHSFHIKRPNNGVITIH